MPMQEIYTKPGHLIRRCQQIAVAIFIEECAAYDITPVQYAALVAVRENPEVDATRLSALIAFDRSTLGNVLERLELKGLVERSGRPEDKRIKVLKLSRKGRDTLRKVEPCVVRAQERIVAPLAPDEQRVFMDLLAKLVHLNNQSSRVPLRVVSSG